MGQSWREDQSTAASTTLTIETTSVWLDEAAASEHFDAPTGWYAFVTVTDRGWLAPPTVWLGKDKLGTENESVVSP